MTDILSKPLGFIGLGAMGEPMALNLLRAGAALTVWNRSAPARDRLAQAGARVAGSVDEAFAACETLILMLANADAIDAVLQRGEPAFGARVAGRTVINMGTTMPAYSKALEAQILSVGGRYVEAPVSGSRQPAQAGQLVAMAAGEAQTIEAVRDIFQPLCRDVVDCGAVPNALLMKLAVNLFLIATVTGLAESVHFAQHQGLDLGKLAAILNAGQMASDVSRVKLAKLLAGDFSKQAGIADVLENNRLIACAAQEAGVAAPLLDACHALYRETCEQGLGESDMITVILALQARTQGLMGNRASP
ncbi:MAG: NAD(P)-dependent oxidoreductase [Vampirovibrionales bacterium]|nr:NAD(P)-dependent oxidoreductase [Vampirovibrionales bacterium]